MAGVGPGPDAIAGISQAVQNYTQLRLTDELEISSQVILQHAASLDLSFEDSRVKTFCNERPNPGALCLTFVLRFLKIGSATLQSISLLGILLYIEPVLTWLLVLIVLPFLGLQTWVADARYSADRAKTRVRRWGNYYRGRLTTPKAVSSSRLMGLAPLMQSRYEDSVRNALAAMRHTYRVELIGRIIVVTGFILAFGIAVSVQGMRVIEESMEIGQFVVYWMAAWRFKASLTTLVEQLSRTPTGLAVSNLMGFCPLSPVSHSAVRQPQRTPGEIELQNVTFITHGERPALRDVTSSEPR